jgi:hypothetical protein
LAIGIGVVAWHQWPSNTAPHVPDESKSSASASPPEQPARALEQPLLQLPEPRLDGHGLPSRDLAWREQWTALETAAANGDARAACRLSLAAMGCASLANVNREAAVAMDREATLQQMKQADALGESRAEILATAPESLRADLALWIDAATERGTEPEVSFSTLASQCRGLPPQDPAHVLGWLRQAALGGHPEALAAYTHGIFAIQFFGLNAASSNDHGPEAGFHWIRSPGFRAWRREALALRRAGLERGDLAMLRAEVAFDGLSLIERLAPRDPVDSAAATRALALLALGPDAPSTSSLGLEAEPAERADRLSMAWAAAARRRGAPQDYVPSGPSARPDASADCP